MLKLYRIVGNGVLVFYRTKRTIVRHLPDHMRRAERQAQWGGTIHLK
jgi:hypothetical protein